MKIAFKIYLLLLFSFQIKAQLLFYQDTYKGGCTADGVAYTDFNELQADTINFQLHIPATSTIKKAFLFTNRHIWVIGSNPIKDAPLPIKFNTINLSIDSSTIVTPVFHFLGNATSWICGIDVTTYMQHTGNTLMIPNQVGLMLADPSRDFLYTGYYLVVLYQDNTMQTNNSVIVLNSQDENTNNTYSINGLNPVNTANDVGLSFWTDYACSIYNPGTQIQYALQSSIGTFTLGILDENNGSGTCLETLPGNFYYQNAGLFGLGADINSPFINGTDAIANIKTYLANNTTSFNLIASTQVSGNASSLRDGYVLAYTTPCPARSNKDTTLSYSICSGNTVQLNGTSSGTYKWSAPSNSLNNYSIPNPVANPTTTTTYIASVDSNGCKHIEQYKVNVYTTPKTDSVKTTVGICGSTQGTATIVATVGSPTSYTVNGMVQSSPIFTNLAAGTYTFALSNTFGCSYASPKAFIIKDTNIASSNFLLTPDSGCMPLNVSCLDYNYNSNLSYVWYFNGDSATTQNLFYTYTDTGKYGITLFVYNNIRSCNATSTQTLHVKYCPPPPPDSISIKAPNVFSPNGDNVNDTWQLIIFNRNYTISNYQCTIYDRWGLKVFTSTLPDEGWTGRTTSGIACSADTYYYYIKITETNSKGTSKATDFMGFLELVR